MIIILPTGCIPLLAILCLAAPEQPISSRTPSVPLTVRQDPAPPPSKHLVLVVQGSVLDLNVTHAVAKPTPWGGFPKGTAGRFAIRILGANNDVLSRIPLDLSLFDTDVARVGGPMQVRCCKVDDPRIATLVNIPLLANARRYEFLRGDKLIGTTTHDRISLMLKDRR